MARALFFGAMLVLCAAGAANAQSTPEDKQAAAKRTPPSLDGPSIPAWVMDALPSGGSVFQLIETIPPDDVVSQRIEGGGMYTGTAPRIGAHGSSSTQTIFRVGDINITAPEGSGT